MVTFNNGRPSTTAVGILRIALPTGAESRFGYDHGFINDRDVVDLMLARYKSDKLLTGDEEDLALLLSDDLYRVREILNRVEIEEAQLPVYRRVWKYILVRQIMSSIVVDPRAAVDDPIYDVYAAFDYDDDLLDLLPAPLEPDYDESIEVLRSRQRLWVELESLWYERHLERQVRSTDSDPST